MKYHLDFQYRPNEVGARPQEAPLHTMSGELMTIVLEDGGAIPNIGDHVHFHRAGVKKNDDGSIESVTMSVEGIVENRLFRFFTNDDVFVNVVVTESTENGGKLIKE